VSTQINITVGSGGLSERVTQQQLAARQAQLEKERQQRIEAQGTEQRNAKLAAEGKAPDGSPLNGPGFNQPDVERRPAANRLGGTNFVLVPHETYNVSGIAVKTKNINNKNFSYRNLAGSLYSVPDFISSGGPSNAPYLQPKFPPNSISDVTLLEYAICNNTDVVGLGNTPVQIRTSTGAIITPTQITKPIHILKNYTVECFLYAPDIPAIDTSLFPEECILDDGSIATSCSNLYTSPQASATVRLLTTNPETSTDYIFFSASITSLTGSGNLSVVNMGKQYFNASVETGRWHHIAVSVTNDNAAFYLNGSSVEPNIIIPGNWEAVHQLPSTTIAQAAAGTSVTVGAGLAPNGAFYSGIHGFRFTPKALYTTTFTPPSSITSFA
jgi:hypothetical protein